MDEAMLEAHVAYEMGRLTGPGLADTVNDEVGALFTWLGTVTLADVVDADAVTAAAVRVVRELPDSGLAQQSPAVLEALRRAVRESPDTVGDLVTQDDAVRWATTIAAMDEARDTLLTQLTSSGSYSRLVAHVVYYGVKSYLLTENALAKRIPGASSLVRLGQRSLGAAAPGLEANVDKQLVAFVDSSIADTVRESRRFLDRMLDEASVEQSAAEGWAAVADHPVSGSADVLTEAEANALADLVWEQWTALRQTTTVENIVDAVVRGFIETNAQRPARDVLADVGVTDAWVAEWLTPVLDASLADDGVRTFVEARVRARLEGFYASYDG